MTAHVAASPPTTDPAGSHRPPAEDHETSGERTRRLLTRAQHAEAGERQRLIEEVVESHLPLARSLARRFSYRSDDSEDLFQVACLGLVQACHRFDPVQPSFVSFAIPTITGMMQRHLRDHSWLVRPPRGAQELALKIDKQWPRLNQELGAAPDDTALAARIGQGVSVEQIREARLATAGRRNTSLDAPTSRAATFAAPLEDEVASHEARLLVQKGCRQLDPADQELLRRRFYDDQPQAEIAAALGVSQMQVSRRLRRIFTTLRAAIGEIDEQTDISTAA
jgi:RNA polymerase sigma-B factor